MVSRIIKHRTPLYHTFDALGRGALTLGFIGGSITDGRPRHNWPEYVTAWFVDHFPDVQIYVENAAIGATGSDLAVFRVQRDLLDRGCDLVFVEYAVNDISVCTQRRAESREGLLRQLLSPQSCDVVSVYTFVHDMADDMLQNRVPPSICEFEALCDHYGISSVWMAREALDQVLKGYMRWEEWLPDGLHPHERGSYCYAGTVIQYLEQALEHRPDGMPPSAHPGLPGPLTDSCWEKTEFVPFEHINKQGPWVIRRSITSTWVDRYLYTSSPSASLRFAFTGRHLLVCFDFGKLSSDICWRVDNGEWQVSTDTRTDWMGDSGQLWLRELLNDPKGSSHTVELRPVHPGRGRGNGVRCDIAFFGVVK